MQLHGTAPSAVTSFNPYFNGSISITDTGKFDIYEPEAFQSLF